MGRVRSVAADLLREPSRSLRPSRPIERFHNSSAIGNDGRPPRGLVAVSVQFAVK
jgi:hypothetical protein